MRMKTEHGDEPNLQETLSRKDLQGLDPIPGETGGDEKLKGTSSGVNTVTQH